MLFITYVGILFFRPIETEDIWWHLKAGEYIVHHHQVPQTDPFPFAGERTRWILTQWMGSLIYFLVYRMAGLSGLTFFRVGLFGLIVLIFMLYARRRLPLSGNILLSLLLAQALSYRVLLRPFVFNFLFIELFLILLWAYQRHPRRQYLFGIALSNLIWVNMHLGSFMYGLTLAGIFFLAAGTRAVRERTASAVAQCRELGILLVVLGASHLLTPYGPDGALHPWRALFVTDYIYFHQLSQSIAELLPPPLLSLRIFWWVFALLALDIAAVKVADRDRFLKLILIAVSAGIFLIGRRGCVFFALSSGFVIAETFAQSGTKWPPWLRRAAPFIALAVLTGVSWRPVTFLATASVVDDGRLRPYFSIRTDPYCPRRTVDRMEDYPVTGAVFNDDKYGGYLLWRSYPRLRPFVDSRQINGKNFQIYQDIRNNPQTLWSKAQALFHFKAVLLDASKAVNDRLVKYFQASPKWRSVFVEGSAVLWLPADGPAGGERSMMPFGQAGFVSDQVLDDEINALLNSRPQSDQGVFYAYIEPEATGATLFYLGYQREGLRKILEAYHITLDSGILHTLRLLQSQRQP